MILENIAQVFIPILIHFAISAGITSVFYQRFDPALLTSMSAVLVLPVLAWMLTGDQKKYGTQDEKKKMPAWSYLIIAAIGIFSNQILSYLVALVQSVLGLSNAVQESLFGSGLWVQIFGLGILVPIMEEILFRGLIYQRLKRWLNSRKAAIFTAAFLFAAYHGNAVQFLFAMPMALLLIWVYEKWGTLKAPVVFHIAVNLSSVLLNIF